MNSNNVNIANSNTNQNNKNMATAGMTKNFRCFKSKLTQKITLLVVAYFILIN